MELEVTVAKDVAGRGWKALLQELPAMWSTGDTIEDAIANFNRSYDSLPFTYKFVVDTEGTIG